MGCALFREWRFCSGLKVPNRFYDHSYLCNSLSDYKARVFSADPTRQASAEQQAVSLTVCTVLN